MRNVFIIAGVLVLSAGHAVAEPQPGHLAKDPEASTAPEAAPEPEPEPDPEEPEPEALKPDAISDPEPPANPSWDSYDKANAPVDVIDVGVDTDAASGQEQPSAPASASAAMTGEVIEITGRVAPGSDHTVTEEQLERFEHNDIHRVLAQVPGVYIREEDGYGLRPNIGMRGAASNRSAKIVLMEDGALIAPAPYSAPAAYYFPVVTRMRRIDVVKGPASIEYGPNTVGGAVDLISAEIPADRHAEIDIAAGGDLYGKVHARAGDRTEHFGILVEGVKLRSSGFKVLDTGGDTGFDKNDVLVKLRANTDTSDIYYNQLVLKLGYSDEVSNETYTGLSDEDFAATPYRRYAGTQLDRMQWDHTQVQLIHRAELAAYVDITTDIYRNDFFRRWRKLNGFNTDRALYEVLANPDSGANAVLYQVLTGEANSMSPATQFVLGTNARDFVSQGIQTVVHTQQTLGPSRHDLSLGLRFHMDSVERFHTGDNYWMRDRALVHTDADTYTTLDATGSAQAWAVFVKEKAELGPITVTGGMRAEMVNTEWENRMDPALSSTGSYSALIPGIGAVYAPTEQWAFLAGVHKGFVPVAPGQPDSIDPEESVNYEAGVRFGASRLRAEVIGFFSDYSNLKGTCTLSSGCTSEQIDDEFNGGAVHIHGAEVLVATELALAKNLAVPGRLAYTYTDSAFQTAFESSNPSWGDVEPGFELPYLPNHQLSAQVGLRGKQWEVAVSGHFVGRMRDVAGEVEPEVGTFTERSFILDAAASYSFGKWGKAYVTVDNLLDQAHIVSRRPYGARPSMPRLVIVGYKAELF